MIWKWRNILKIKWIQYISSSKPLINPTRTSFTNLSEKNYIKHFFYKFLYGCDYCKCRNVITEFSVRHFPILFRLSVCRQRRLNTTWQGSIPHSDIPQQKHIIIVIIPPYNEAVTSITRTKHTNPWPHDLSRTLLDLHPSMANNSIF